MLETILLVRDPFSGFTEPNNVIKLLCSRVDSLSLSRASTLFSRLRTLSWEIRGNNDLTYILIAFGYLNS